MRTGEVRSLAGLSAAGAGPRNDKAPDRAYGLGAGTCCSSRLRRSGAATASRASRCRTTMVTRLDQEIPAS
jgi:hypothetical protein